MSVHVALRQPWRAIGATMAALAVALVPAPFGAGAEEEPKPGDAGTDTSLPETDSAVTVRGRGEFAGMELTINQTKDLTNQAISLTWSGAPPTVALQPRIWFSHFLQVMQCWGEPDGSVPENPGPPPENCVWGAKNPTAFSSIAGFSNSAVTSRSISHRSNPDFDPSAGTVDEQTGQVFRDFIAVDGTRVTDHVDASAGEFEQYWQNPYFNSVTSNELVGARTLGDGSGQALFTVDTGVESNGLGCGQNVEATTGGGSKVPRCWLVVVPRGDPSEENKGSAFLATDGVATSPLRPNSWKNRIAIPLEFRPVDSPCDIGDDQRRINGTELLLTAVASWQPALCTGSDRPPYAYGTVGDPLARRQLISDDAGAPGMIAVNRPLAAEDSTADDPIVYAPLSVSGAVVGFNVERVRALTTEDDRLQGLRYAEINLTPRLVAKLLTQSYRGQLEIASRPSPYEWAKTNPLHLLADPDFLQFNPEFLLWGTGAIKEAGGLLLPAGSSDVATQVWEWVLSDPEAARWMGGEPDDWGMVVNPVYSTDGEENSSGFPFGDPIPDSFPKSDPYCYEAPELASGVVPPPLCGLDWFPFTSGLTESARLTAAATDNSRTVFNLFAGAPLAVWQRTTPQSFGRRTMFGLSDSPTAYRYGIQMARLSRAGDNGDDREFVAPDVGALQKAVDSMVAAGDALVVDPTRLASGAYPLTAVTYGALRPLALEEAAREDYAAFIRYAAGPGQALGTKLGQLPPGFAPLPSELTAQAADAAELITTLEAPEQPPVTTTTTTTLPTKSTSSPPSTTTTSSTVPPMAGGSPTVLPAQPGPSPVMPRQPSRSSAPSVPTGTEFEPPSPTAPAPVGDDTADIQDEAAARVPLSNGQATPVVSIASSRYFVALLALITLLAALGCLEITKRPRRGSSTNPQPPTDLPAP